MDGERWEEIESQKRGEWRTYTKLIPGSCSKAHSYEYFTPSPTVRRALGSSNAVEARSWCRGSRILSLALLMQTSTAHDSGLDRFNVFLARIERYAVDMRTIRKRRHR